MKTIKVGIIGLGRMGMLHLVNCSHMDGVKVIAAVDSSKKGLRKAESLGVKNLYKDYHDLLRHSSEMDAVIISLPNFMHFESILLSLETDLNVFAEKPLAITTEECRQIVKKVDNSGRGFMVGHVLRFTEAIEKMKLAVNDGLIGDLEVVTLEEIINGPFALSRRPSHVSDWWFDPKRSGGGALMDIGYHMIDLYRFFAGDSHVVFSSLDHKFSLPVEDGAIAIIQSSNGNSTKGIINVGWYEQTVFPRYNFRAILHGAAGYLSSEDLAPRSLYTHAAKVGIANVLRRVAGRRIRPLYYTYHYESFYKELAHFFDCLRNDTRPCVTALDGLRVIELIQEAYTLEKAKMEVEN
jgi:myo-inositol 2-dehydrogenase/D-chiro-inositol 1-dehydrogenase